MQLPSPCDVTSPPGCARLTHTTQTDPVLGADVTPRAGAWLGRAGLEFTDRVFFLVSLEPQGLLLLLGLSFLVGDRTLSPQRRDRAWGVAGEHGGGVWQTLPIPALSSPRRDLGLTLPTICLLAMKWDSQSTQNLKLSRMMWGSAIRARRTGWAQPAPSRPSQEGSRGVAGRTGQETAGVRLALAGLSALGKVTSSPSCLLLRGPTTGQVPPVFPGSGAQPHGSAVPGRWPRLTRHPAKPVSAFSTRAAAV